MKTLFSENLGFWVETEGLGPNLGSTVSLRIEYFFKIETFLKLYNGTLDFWQIWQIFGTYGGYLANFWYLRGVFGSMVPMGPWPWPGPGPGPGAGPGPGPGQGPISPFGKTVSKK